VPEGRRAFSHTSLAGKLLYHDIPPEITHEICLAVNMRNQPPEDEEKVSRDVMAIIARDLARVR
jgi:hypothetical protein